MPKASLRDKPNNQTTKQLTNLTPLFSILIANYNNGKYIAECLGSVLNQDYSNIEIILVDDGSTDNSLAIIQPYLTQHQNIKLFINETNKGVGYTKKRCIDEASGEICGFVDPDDTITLTAISKMVAAHQQQPDVALVYSDYYECDERLQVLKTYQPRQVENGKIDFFNDGGDIGPFATFKSKYYRLTKGLNIYLKRAIDQDLYLKLYDVGDCIYLPEALYHYRMHNQGLATNAQADLAYYWYWVVKIMRAQSLGIDLEKDFNHTFMRKASLNYKQRIIQKLVNSSIVTAVKQRFKSS